MKHPQIYKILYLATLFFLLTLSGTGCNKEKAPETPTEAFEIEKVYERGPVTFILKASRQEITIADRLRLSLEVRAREEYEVSLPEFGEKLEQFGITDYHAPPPQLIKEGMVQLKKSYELEPFLSGKYKIPPMKVVFWKKGEDKRHKIESEELTIQVKSLLPDKMADLAIKEIVPPVALPEPLRWWIFGLIAVGVLGAGGTAAFLLLRRRGAKAEAALRRAAHEIAYEELEALLKEKLVEKGMLKTFYLRLSNILRHYIENRFALRAPERTTEEFLAEIRTTEALVSSHKELLKAFLSHCDLVKFAEHHPTNDEIQKTFDACKQFIVETEIREPATVAPS
ncbi:MAG: hypothetical protein JSU92_05850 [Deltaproteobacteria bacterium]|nr:MAG: hypothetical protein JSU92_05850 [Deltaproteobacteria bacterium]